MQFALIELEPAHLGGDELEAGVLPPCLLVDDVLHLGVDLTQRRVQRLVLRNRRDPGVNFSTFTALQLKDRATYIFACRSAGHCTNRSKGRASKLVGETQGAEHGGKPRNSCQFCRCRDKEKRDSESRPIGQERGSLGSRTLAYINVLYKSRRPSPPFVRLGHCMIVRGVRLGDGRNPAR